MFGCNLGGQYQQAKASNADEQQIVAVSRLCPTSSLVFLLVLLPFSLSLCFSSTRPAGAAGAVSAPRPRSMSVY